jgi:hypothetical protein
MSWFVHVPAGDPSLRGPARQSPVWLRTAFFAVMSVFKGPGRKIPRGFSPGCPFVR